MVVLSYRDSLTGFGWSGNRRLNRKFHDHHSSGLVAVTDVDFSTMVFHNLSGNGQTQSKSRGFCGKVGGKNSFAILRRNARPCICKLQLQYFRAPGAEGAGGAHANLASLRHRLNGIGENVHKTGFHLLCISSDDREILWKFCFDSYALGLGVLFNQRDSLFQSLPQVASLKMRRVLAAAERNSFTR